MKQYNIYAGLGGSFGGAKYQYTGLYETEEEAEDDAFQEACEIYDENSYLYNLSDWEDVKTVYCLNKGISLEEFDYYVIPTDKDNIDQGDLILNYIIEDDSSS